MKLTFRDEEIMEQFSRMQSIYNEEKLAIRKSTTLIISIRHINLSTRRVT